MWNHLVRFNGQAYEAKYRNLNVDAERPARSLATEGVSAQEYPYWDTSEDRPPTPTGASSSPTPARRAAPARRCWCIDPLDIGDKDRRAWSTCPASAA